MKAVDFHAHAFHDKIAKKAANNLNTYYGIPLAADGSFCHILNSMKENHIDKMVINATATAATQVELINDYISGLVSDDIIGFGTLHIDYAEFVKEIDRIISLGLKGIKFHPVFQRFAIDDERMFPIYEALEGRLPVLMHVGDKNCDLTTPKRLANVLDRFPKLTVIGAHLGGYSEWDESMKYLVGRNLYFDTSSAIRFLSPKKSLEIIRKHGADKVLFGTDYPLAMHKEELENLNKIPLTEEEKELILWKNAYKLLNIEE